jgi:hypothetical protein
MTIAELPKNSEFPAEKCRHYSADLADLLKPANYIVRIDAKLHGHGR